jgi:uncharacterized protein with ATP-grasp and redox domains
VRTSLDCLTCLVRQAIEASRFVSDDPALHERVVRDVLRMAAEFDFAQPPPLLAQRVQRRIRELTGAVDPYTELKLRADRAVLAALPALSAEVGAADDPLAAAVRLAIAGNTIDAGAYGAERVDQMARGLTEAKARPFSGDLEGFRRAATSAREILYLTDNAGETVLDRLLVERLPAGRITFAVRGAAVLNDATREDAARAGLDSLGEVIDNGSDAPGTVLSECSDTFRRRFAAADLVIAKGQGNYETLSEADRDIFFLFAVKCDVAARHCGRPRGTLALLRSRAGRTDAAKAHTSALRRREGGLLHD